MKHLLCTLVLLTATAPAVACPVKAGYVANGQFKNTTGLVPLCTAQFKALAAGVKPGEYGEFYKTSLDFQGGLNVGKLSKLFTSNGWQKLKSPNSKTLAFKQGKKQTVVTVREGDDYVLVIVLGDK